MFVNVKNRGLHFGKFKREFTRIEQVVSGVFLAEKRSIF